MLNYRKILQCTLLVCLVMTVFAAPASAADVLATIRERAASLLKGLKPVIFILAGFGLIGFAWMAIFDKISWKWFSNIAIGLFLVANMGIFIDYFTTKEGKGKAYGELLDRSDYKDNMGDGYQGTDGTDGDPLGQKPGSNEGAAGPSGSDELDSEYEKALAGVTDEKTCAGAGGVWENDKCTSKGSAGGTDTAGYADGVAFEQELAQNKDQKSCTENGGTWDKNKCVAPWAAGDNGTSFTERLDCANSGGNWDGSKCVKNSQPPSGAGTPGVINPPAGSGTSGSNCAAGKSWDPVAKKCVSGTPAYSEAKANGADGSKCGVNQVFVEKMNACANIRADVYQDKMNQCSARRGTFKDGNCVVDLATEEKLNAEIVACRKNGGIWDGSKCVKNSQPPSGAGTPGVINPPAGDTQEKPAVPETPKCKDGQAWSSGLKKCVAAEEAKCYESGAYSYSKEWGCVSRSEFQDKVANAERKCAAQDGYEYVADKYNLSAPGSCQKTKKQGDRDCKSEQGDDYEWDSSKQECAKKEKAQKKDCKTLGADYEWDSGRSECKKTAAAINKDCEAQGMYQFDSASGKCISEDEACEQKSGYIWKNGKCDTALGFAKSECDEKGSDYMFTNQKCMTKQEECTSRKSISGGAYIWKDGKCETELAIADRECKAKGSDYMLTSNRECVTRQSECLKDSAFVWVDGKCRAKILIEKEECAAKGSDYKWDGNLRTCSMTTKAAKKDCESKPGYFWSDDYNRCIKEE